MRILQWLKIARNDPRMRCVLGDRVMVETTTSRKLAKVVGIKSNALLLSIPGDQPCSCGESIWQRVE